MHQNILDKYYLRFIHWVCFATRHLCYDCPLKKFNVNITLMTCCCCCRLAQSEKYFRWQKKSQRMRPKIWKRNRKIPRTCLQHTHANKSISLSSIHIIGGIVSVAWISKLLLSWKQVNTKCVRSTCAQRRKIKPFSNILHTGKLCVVVYLVFVCARVP